MQEPSICSWWTVCDLIINYPVYLLIIDECIYFPVISLFFPPLRTIFQGNAMESYYLNYVISTTDLRVEWLPKNSQTFIFLFSYCILYNFWFGNCFMLLLTAPSSFFFWQPQILSRMFRSVEVSSQIICWRLIVLQSNDYRSYLSV